MPFPEPEIIVKQPVEPEEEDPADVGEVQTGDRPRGNSVDSVVERVER